MGLPSREGDREGPQRAATVSQTTRDVIVIVVPTAAVVAAIVAVFLKGRRR